VPTDTCRRGSRRKPKTSETLARRPECRSNRLRRQTPARTRQVRARGRLQRLPTLRRGSGERRIRAAIDPPPPSPLSLGIALFVWTRICRMPPRIPRTSFRCYVAAKHRRDAHAGRLRFRDCLARQLATMPNPMRTGPSTFTISSRGALERSLRDVVVELMKSLAK